MLYVRDTKSYYLVSTTYFLVRTTQYFVHTPQYFVRTIQYFDVRLSISYERLSISYVQHKTQYFFFILQQYASVLERHCFTIYQIFIPILEGPRNDLIETLPLFSHNVAVKRLHLQKRNNLLLIYSFLNISYKTLLIIFNYYMCFIVCVYNN